MPPVRSRTAATKKHALTLAQLASYDDILTDALVDHVYYWTTIPKNRPSYLPSRGVKEDEIAKIIQTHLAVTPDLQVAEEKLLATSGLAKFYRTLRTDQEKEDFRRHMRRYMQIYLPDCPFEVTSTNRYTIFQQEASISARRFIKSHETIKFLSGIQVAITPEEEARLSERKKDFSIVISSRKKEVNLFMGPARFANHDCDANARLVTTGQSGIEIIATKPIGVGDEITVTYGDNYFGDDNCECLCKTCEDNLANGWASKEGNAPLKQSIEGSGASTPSRGYCLRRRDDNAANRGQSETPSLTPMARPKVRRTKMKAIERTDDANSAVGREPGTFDFETEQYPRSQKRERDCLATPPVTPAKRPKRMPTPLQGDTYSDQLSGGSREGSIENSLATDSLAPEEKPLCQRLEYAGSSSSSSLISQTTESGQEDDESRAGARTQVPTPESSQQLTDVEPEVVVPVLATDGDTIVVKEIEQPLRQGHENSIPSLSLTVHEPGMDMNEDENIICLPDSAVSAQESDVTESSGWQEKEDTGSLDAPEDRADKQAPGLHRVPGDYTLTPLLLSEPETAWVFCTVCSSAFVQRDAYYTRMSCPRCEKHSKIYGFLWPKTEPEGKWDKEERILDHRLVHRFLDPEDEAKARGRKRPVWQSALEDEHRSRRNSSSTWTSDQAGAGSGIWRKLKYMMPKEEKQSKSRAPTNAKDPKKRHKPGSLPGSTLAAHEKEAAAGHTDEKTVELRRSRRPYKVSSRMRRFS